jgi:G3E family GTPase
MELVGGCVCHEVKTQDELVTAIGEIARRGRPERIVLETTGIAEPDAIIEALAALPAERRAVTVAGIVTVVDAESGAAQLARHPEAKQQVRAASRVLLSKLDRLGDDRATALVELHELLARLNPDAERAGFPDTALGTAQLIPWLLEPDASPRAAPHHDHAPHAHSQLVAFTFSDPAPLVPGPLVEVLAALGPALVRAKGFVNVAGEERRGFVERAGATLELRLEAPWPEGARRSEFVLIGEGLDTAALERQLWACRLPAGPPASPPETPA